MIVFVLGHYIVSMLINTHTFLVVCHTRWILPLFDSWNYRFKRKIDVFVMEESAIEKKMSTNYFRQ